MRIAFVTPEFVTENYFSGGLANYVQRISIALAALGHDVHVLTLSNIDKKEFNYEGVKVYRIQTGRPRRWLSRLSRHRLSGTAQWLDFSFQAYRRVAKLHKQKPFDILQFPNSRACGLVTSLLLPVPYALRISCYRPVWNKLSGGNRNLDAKACEFLEFICYRLAKNIFAPSLRLKNMLAEKANIKNVRVIRTPFFQEILQLDDSVYKQYLGGKDYLLFFGRLQMHKGAHILGQALSEVFSRLPGIYAVFVGLDASSPLGQSMRRYITQQCDGSTERVIFIDALYHEQLYPVINGARLVVLPSLVDNLPNTMLEAMAFCKAVLGTIGCSFDEIIEDGRNGFLVNPGNPTELAQKIVEVWHRKDLDEIGRSAARKIEELAPDKVVTQLIDYYREVIGKNKRR